MREFSADVAIVGGGIVGLAHAYFALQKGYKVVLFEREQFSIGASVRNFGLVWPIGQEPGNGLEDAMRSRQHWLEVTDQAGCWINFNGSLHAAYHDDEWMVLQEFAELYRNGDYAYQLLQSEEATKKSNILNGEGLKGALWSATECVVNPREVIRKIPLWLQEKFGLQLRFGHVVTEISLPLVKSSRETWRVDKVFVCSGADFETLYPHVYDQHHARKCKLQMMKAVTKKSYGLGPTLCAGLTLRHYAAFKRCPSLLKLKERYDKFSPFYNENGIHVLLAQNGHGEFIIGDSHHYGQTLEPFDQESVSESIVTYLSGFAKLGEFRITERWHGIYPKIEGALNLTVQPEDGVTIVNCLGGAGMTLSFGLAERNVSAL